MPEEYNEWRKGMSDIIKCNKCGHVLIYGSGAIFFGIGTSIECLKCGNIYTFGSDKQKLIEEEKNESN